MRNCPIDMLPLLKLTDYGQSYWMDDLGRDMLDSGELAQRVTEQGLRGITSNPTIFDKAITGSRAYDDQIAQLARAGVSVHQSYEELMVTDVRRACDVLRSVYDATDGLDGFVSLEVSPGLAHDAQASIEEGRRLASMVARPNLFIKIPGTREGLPVIEELLFQGLNINITLLFGVGRYEQVAEAYLRALERRLEAGRQVTDVASVASFFVSRIDTLVDMLLAHRIRPDGGSPYDPHPETLMGQAAIANAKLAYRVFKRIASGERWKALMDKGARPQRLLWASTSTKNPRYPDVMYVEALIGPETVTTVTRSTIAAFADHGKVHATLESGTRDASRIMQSLRKLGIDFKQVTEQLENEGIQKFIESHDALLRSLDAKRSKIGDRSNLKAAAPVSP